MQLRTASTLPLTTLPLTGIAALAAASAYFLWGGRSTPPSTNGATSTYVQLPAAREDIQPVLSATPLPAVPDNLSDLVRQEPRDADWADRSEASVRRNVNKIPFMSDGGPLQVTCAATVCEVSGHAPTMLEDKDLPDFWALLQGPIVKAPLEESGLEMSNARFGAPGSPRTFVLFLIRRS